MNFYAVSFSFLRQEQEKKELITSVKTGIQFIVSPREMDAVKVARGLIGEIPGYREASHNVLKITPWWIVRSCIRGWLMEIGLL